jgi:hypothetical protein
MMIFCKMYYLDRNDLISFNTEGSPHQVAFLSSEDTLEKKIEKIRDCIEIFFEDDSHGSINMANVSLWSIPLAVPYDGGDNVYIIENASS